MRSVSRARSAICAGVLAAAAISGVVAAVPAASAGTVAAASGGGDLSAGRGEAAAWGLAVEVPGSAALNAGGQAELDSISCGAAGSCSAGGYYTGASGRFEAFVVSQKDGRWGKAAEVPGSAALNKFGYAGIVSVSCASAGNCSAGGYYAAVHNEGESQTVQALVVSQKDGTWGKAIEVPGVPAPSTTASSAITSVSCVSAGNCSAGGGTLFNPSGRSGGGTAFVVSQKDGTWGKAVKVSGVAATGKTGGSGITSMSCPSAGNCSAGGFYTGHGSWLAFVVSQKDGTWGKAIEVPGTAVVKKGAYSFNNVTSVSCGSAGDCSAGGFYTDAAGTEQAFVVSQKDGTWGKAIDVPGSAALNTGGDAAINAVSCAGAGDCSAGGYVAVGDAGTEQAFVVSQKDGTWGKAIEVPGTAALNAGGGAQTSSVSCPSAGNCSAAGYYTTASGDSQAFVVSEDGGIWGTALELPGTAVLNAGGNASADAVSCASPDRCSAGGFYTDSRDHMQVFVASQQ